MKEFRKLESKNILCVGKLEFIIAIENMFVNKLSAMGVGLNSYRDIPSGIKPGIQNERLGYGIIYGATLDNENDIYEVCLIFFKLNY